MLALEEPLTKLMGVALRFGMRALNIGVYGAGLTSGSPSPQPWNPLPRQSLTSADLQRMARATAARLGGWYEREFHTVPQNERLAAIQAVSDTFGKAGPLTATLMMEIDLDPRQLRDRLREQDPARPRTAGLDATGGELYEALLDETCVHLVQWMTEQESFVPLAQVELVRRTGRLANDLKQALRRPDDQEDSAFEQRYLKTVASQLNRLELFGVTLNRQRHYPMSSAYISLSVAYQQEPGGIPPLLGTDQRVSVNSGARVEQALWRFQRMLLRGEAGSGKTTLLRWLAVRAARRDFSQDLRRWNGLVPFFLPLRGFGLDSFPSPQHFVAPVARHISDLLPQGWVHHVLESGRGLVLVDGVDELLPKEREKAREWLRGLIATFPESRYVVTSRPSAAEENWLGGDGFTPMELLPMNLPDIREFLRCWHRAMREECRTQQESQELERCEQQLAAEIPARPHLRQLATNPLLAALLCALHHDRRMQLPKGRMDLYKAALEMLLIRRDTERNIQDEVGLCLGRDEKEQLLRKLARWLLINGKSDASLLDAARKIEPELATMDAIQASPEQVLDHLLDRTGLLRRPVEGRIDFVHRTFQEYLASAALLDGHDQGLLVSQAHQDAWHETVVMAVGHARQAEREELLRELLARGEREPEHRVRLHLLAAACLETATTLAPEVRAEIRDAAARLVPPQNMSEARDLANAGEMALTMIGRLAGPLTETQAAAAVRTATLVGGDSALAVLERYSGDDRGLVVDELLRSWSTFAPEEYARRVLAGLRLGNRPLEVASDQQLRAVRHLRYLRYLHCEGDLDPQPVLGLPELISLTLRDNTGLDGRALAGLAELRHLQHLGLESCSPLADLRWLTTLPALSSLLLRPVTDLTGLPALPRLRTAHLGWVESPGGAPRQPLSLSGLDRVVSVHTLVLYGLADDGTSGLLSQLPELNSLGLHGGPSQPVRLPKQTSAVQLDLCGTALVNGLEQLANWPNLRRIQLDAVVAADDPDGSLDLAPLAGADHLTVVVREGQRLRGLERLGLGVQVYRPTKQPPRTPGPRDGAGG